MATITWLSLYPVTFPEVPGEDKTLHIVAYMCCVLPVSFARPHYLLRLFITIFIWSGAMELIQPYVNRHADWLDLAANATGIGLGFLLGWGVSKLWRK